MGHDGPGHDLVHVHRDIMLVASGLALLITAVGWWARDRGRAWRIGLATAALLLVGVTMVGADRGAELAFRYGIGVAMDPIPESDGHHHDHDDHGHGHGEPTGHHEDKPHKH